MTSIDPHVGLAALVQREMALLRQRRGMPAGAALGQAAEAKVPSAAATLSQRIRGIAPADPDARGKAVRIYLESELAREFGSAVLNDPEFPRMLDAIAEQMQQDAQVAAAVHALGDLLLSGKAP